MLSEVETSLTIALGLASVANVERSFDSAQDDNLKGGSTCHFIKDLVRFRGSITSGFIATVRTPTFKNEGIDYEHVVTTEGFNEAFSIMYHLRPPTRVRSVKLLKCEELKKAADSPLRHHHLRTANMREAAISTAVAFRFFSIRT